MESISVTKGLEHRPTAELGFYRYVPLDKPTEQVRLLQILPGAMDDPLILKIETVDFDPRFENDEYEALSYTWGSQDVKVDVRIQPDFRLEVTPHLEAALRHLRLSDASRTMFIDAISIDQSNKQERGHQVRIMGGIFEAARQVIVWLGPRTTDSDRAMELLDHMGGLVEYDDEFPAFSLIILGEQQPEWTDWARQLPFSKADVVAMGGFLGNPWFERLWIRQEVLLAGGDVKILCGSTSLS